MPQEYPLSIRFRAEELYVEAGLNFEEVSRATRPLVKELCGEDKGVSVSQLKRWSAEDKEKEGKSWPEKQDERQAALRQIEREKLLLMRDLLDAARSTLDPQKIYAFTRLDKKAATGSRRPEEAPAPDIDRPALFLEDLEFIVRVLKEIDPEGLKVIHRNIDQIVARGKAEYAQTA
ncbi:MAG: hypothetical protein C4567_18695 [Deltaproteobacteria bacterium]|nr:MAG: hypothetical protein C4567_18695 [Deltaproteobacteria bacterium]